MQAKRYIVLFCLCCVAVWAQAQIPFMEHIRKDTGKGKLIVVQSPAIDRVVNSRTPLGKQQAKSHASEASSDSLHRAQPERVQGYRIQIYAGPKANGKEAALNYEKKIKKAFPELSTYVRFIQPRWTCRVGDFATRQEAQEVLNRINEEKISTQTTIVRCEVFKVW